jgi:Zn-dependent peptidase ImmA (M78 family)/transcriptional regulator with XRE-family HTH domain
MIGTRIKIVREILNKTQAEFGEILGTTQSGVASMEAGVYRPSEVYIQTIGQRTGFSPQFFGKGELPDFPFGSMLYRAAASVKQGPRSRAHALAHVSFEFAVELASQLKPIPVNIPRLSDTPKRCAQIARTSLGLSPLSPIKNVVSVLERNGVLVFSLPIEVEGFDGFSAWPGSAPSRPIIALLQGKTAYREVFTCAEELAHLTMHSPLRVSAKDADKQARLFAQEFLLPAEAMLIEMQQPITLSGLAPLKKRWGVSISFLAKRAESLSLVTPNQYRYLLQQMRSAWGGKIEPGDDAVAPERPRLLYKMCEMLYGNPIQLPRLSRESGLPIHFLRSILDLEQPIASVLEFRRK